MKALATALINLAAFVELSGDDIIDPDAAVDALEQLGTDLDEISNEEKSCLTKLIREKIAGLPEQQDDEDRAKLVFLQELLEMLEGV